MSEARMIQAAVSELISKHDGLLYPVFPSGPLRSVEPRARRPVDRRKLMRRGGCLDPLVSRGGKRERGE